MAAIDPIERDRKWLFDNEARYLRAKEYLNSPKRALDIAIAFEKIQSILSLTDVPHEKALWQLGRICQVIEDFREPEELVKRFETLKKSVLMRSGGKE